MADLILKDLELPLQELPNQESQSVVGGLALKTVSTDGLALKTVSTDGLALKTVSTDGVALKTVALKTVAEV